jgi:hypothetical protein
VCVDECMRMSQVADFIFKRERKFVNAIKIFFGNVKFSLLQLNTHTHTHTHIGSEKLLKPEVNIHMERKSPPILPMSIRLDIEWRLNDQRVKREKSCLI